MKKASKPPGEAFKIRCPRLGHMISFSYCREENMGLPCLKTLDCWFQHFMVEDHLRRELSSEEWKKVFNKPPGPKVLSLVDLIEQAKKRNKPS
ncbi:MAG: hypothetical protein JRH06_10430 [Deltaproteobacteria bacterium]|nr:hypothetical protein [Deltaproteobacteria bacterium]MBW2137960.1 hypothetical protein [Deltaproteobacteria bacterium]